MTDNPQTLIQPDHAYYAGLFTGWLLKQDDIRVAPQLNSGGDITDTIVITHDSGAHWHVKVLPPNFEKGEGE